MIERPDWHLFLDRGDLISCCEESYAEIERLRKSLADCYSMVLDEILDKCLEDPTLASALRPGLEKLMTAMRENEKQVKSRLKER